jgi:alpha-2-macroglobulin
VRRGLRQAPATQWFVVSDLGLTALSGNDGLHALVRSLGSAAPLGGIRVRLIARNNEVLGEGHQRGRLCPLRARAPAGQRRQCPALVTAESPDGDYGFLDLTRSPFDLSDRGVEGRPAPSHSMSSWCRTGASTVPVRPSTSPPWCGTAGPGRPASP